MAGSGVIQWTTFVHVVGTEEQPIGLKKMKMKMEKIGLRGRVIFSKVR